jgi:hypothetical protein
MRLLNFTTLDTQLLSMVLGWRNHPKVREWMLHQNEISLDEHLCYRIFKKQSG